MFAGLIPILIRLAFGAAAHPLLHLVNRINTEKEAHCQLWCVHKGPLCFIPTLHAGWSGQLTPRLAPQINRVPGEVSSCKVNSPKIVVDNFLCQAGCRYSENKNIYTAAVSLETHKVQVQIHELCLISHFVCAHRSVKLNSLISLNIILYQDVENKRCIVFLRVNSNTVTKLVLLE